MVKDEALKVINLILYTVQLSCNIIMQISSDEQFSFMNKSVTL